MAMVDISAMLLLLLLVRSSYQSQITCRVTCQMGDTLILTCTCQMGDTLIFTCTCQMGDTLIFTSTCSCTGLLDNNRLRSTSDSRCTCAFEQDPPDYLKMLCRNDFRRLCSAPCTSTFPGKVDLAILMPHK